jgi:hypothetical protein
VIVGSLLIRGTLRTAAGALPLRDPLTPDSHFTPRDLDPFLMIQAGRFFGPTDSMLRNHEFSIGHGDRRRQACG